MRPLTLLSSVAFAASLVAVASPSSAQPAGGVRPHIVVIEGLVGAWQVHAKSGDGEAEDALAIGSPFALTQTNQPLRLGYHHAFDAITLGGGVHYGTFAGGFSNLVLAPRVGVLLGSGDISIWPRVGVTYGRSKFDFGAFSSTTTETKAAADLFFLARLAPHVGLLFGPSVELGLSGKTKGEGLATSKSEDYKSRVIGAQLGLFADF